MYQVSVNPNIYPQHYTQKRCSRSIKRTEESCSAESNRNGFLTHSFLPIWFCPPILLNEEAVIRDFQINIANFNNLYKTEIVLPLNTDYPSNILYVLNEIQNFFDLQRNTASAEIQLIEQCGKVTISVHKEISINNTLYYIDVKPLADLIKQKQYRSANLLLSLFTYLFKITGVSHYSDNFIGGLYEVYLSDEDVCSDNLNTLNDAQSFVQPFTRMVTNMRHLIRFEKRIDTFIPSNDREELLLQIAKDFYDFYLQYPTFNFHDTIRYPDGENLDYYEIMTPDEYLSFCYGLNSDDFDLIYTVNQSLCEKSIIILPNEVEQTFDTPQSTPNSYNEIFVNTYFNLLEQLAHTLEFF